MADPLLVLENVTAGYGAARVLNEVSLSVGEGRRLLCSAATAWARRR